MNGSEAKKNMQDRNVLQKDYLMIRELGGGGDGTVFLVKHIRTEQLRAAKQLETAEGKDAYHELTMMKKLHHPSLPMIIDVLKEDNYVWLIMEYVNGAAIQNYAGKQLRTEEFFQFAEQLVSVVSYLHSRNSPILHLDIKPSNILVKKDGRLVLIDFGTAVMAGQKQCEESRGTPGFAAPEQYRRMANLDERTDIYGIGAVLYYLKNGCVYQERQKISKKSKENEIDRMIARCTAEKPDQRYQNCTQLEREIEKIEKRWKYRKKCSSLLVSVLLLLILLCFSGNAWRNELKEDAVSRVKLAEKLLQESKGVGWEEASPKYKQILEMEPERYDVLLEAVNRILDDFLFTREEEKTLHELLTAVIPGTDRTVEENVMQMPESYGELSYRIGLMYWYFYEGTGGKSAGKDWFEKAAEAGEGLEEYDWKRMTDIYLHISASYERLSSAAVTGNKESYASLWKNLSQLWDAEYFSKMQQPLQEETAMELLNCMIMGASEILSAVPKESTEELMKKIEIFLAEEGTEKAELLDETWKEAAAAWNRACKNAEKQEGGREHDETVWEKEEQ